MRRIGIPQRLVRRLLFPALAGAAVAGTSALSRAEAREAPCGNFTGNKCTELMWCVGLGGNKYCETTTLSYYRTPSGE